MPKIIVYHSLYGCDTGCCGHTIELTDDDGNEIESKFVFEHCWENDVEEQKQWAKELIEKEFGEEHCKDLDWDNCRLVNYC